VEKAVREHPEDPIAQLQYLKLSLEEGQADQAAAAARTIANLKTSAAVMADAGSALLEARQYAQARELLEKAAAADPSANLDLDLAIVVFQTAGAVEGLHRLERVPASQRGAAYHLARARMLDSAGKPEDAIPEMNRAIEASPKDPVLYWQAAVILMHTQRGTEAAALLAKAEQSMPQEPLVPVIRATLLESAGQTEEALQLLAAVRRRWPELAAAWVAAGMIQAAHQRNEEARKALETAVSLGASSPEVRSQLTATPKADVPDPRRLFQLRPPREW